MNTMTKRELMKLRDTLLAERADGKPRTVIKMISKRVPSVTPADRKAMEEAARDPSIRRQYPVLKLEEW